MLGTELASALTVARHRGLVAWEGKGPEKVTFRFGTHVIQLRRDAAVR